jgi:hypothetical protein
MAEPIEKRVQATATRLASEHDRVKGMSTIYDTALHDMAVRELKRESIGVKRVGYDFKVDPEVVSMFIETYKQQRPHVSVIVNREALQMREAQERRRIEVAESVREERKNLVEVAKEFTQFDRAAAAREAKIAERTRRREELAAQKRRQEEVRKEVRAYAESRRANGQVRPLVECTVSLFKNFSKKFAAAPPEVMKVERKHRPRAIDSGADQLAMELF